jgi:hypothetical protein
MRQPCDRCGYSKCSSAEDRGSKYTTSYPLYPSGSHIADASCEIIVSLGRSLYLCSHHYRQHEAFIASRGYIVRPGTNNA